MLGPVPEAAYASGHTRLEPGDALILHTDGLTEASDPEGRMLGGDEVRSALGALTARRPEAIRDGVLERVERHRAGAAASDDLTLLILHREP